MQVKNHPDDGFVVASFGYARSAVVVLSTAVLLCYCSLTPNMLNFAPEVRKRFNCLCAPLVVSYILLYTQIEKVLSVDTTEPAIFDHAPIAPGNL